MNRLQFETSPYLLQHADNPVDWYAWKPEALEAARRADKPILVSIGYSTCHWCHVMERESFEKEAVAAFMNEHFINIKVDREERPDVDQIYMEACQAIHGSGGWPLNCFLTPDGRPYFAGTYYPPQPAHNRPSWLQLLQRMAHAFQQRRQQVEDQAEQLMNLIKRSDDALLRDPLIDDSQEEDDDRTDRPAAIFSAMRRFFDREQGGIGTAPKFPSAMTLDFLLQYGYLSQNQEATDHALFSLDRMVRGGIYDHLGGGMARYATDRAWLVPHFEKMLYDNALLIGLLTSAYQLTGRDSYRCKLEQTLAFVRREMTHEKGGFFAALDADSEGVEGKYYVWSESEIDQVLGQESGLFKAYYGVTEAGNWEGTNILWERQAPEVFARANDLDPDHWQARRQRNVEALLAVREARVRPGRDEKIILGWNAMMVTALARAGAALDHPATLAMAEKALDFLLLRLGRKDGGMWHVFKEGNAQYAAFLDDYALLVEALMAVYETSHDVARLNEALRLTDWVLEHFSDADQALFYYTDDQQQDLILRKRELHDSATPSGNSTMAHNLWRLAIFFDNPAYRLRAERMLDRLRETIEKYPTAFSRWASAFLRLAYPTAEIAIVGPEYAGQARALAASYLPHAVTMATAAARDDFPLLEGKETGGKTMIFVCRDFACRRPVSEVSEALKLVNEST